MTKNIIDILNTRLLTTGYFRELYGLCELVKQDETSYPVLYTQLGERIHVSNFDEKNGLCYWRRGGDITFSDIDNTNNFSNNKLTRVSVPLRVVAVVSREQMTIDNPYNAEVIGETMYGVLNENLNGNVRKQIGARAVYMSLNSLEDSNEKIMRSEFPEGPIMLNDKLVICALNLTVTIEILASCIGTECDLMTQCEALLTGLSTAQKNECILPNYDFSDPNVLSNLTDEQEEDLIEALCEGGDPVTVRNSDSTYNESVDCGGTLVLADQTVNVYIDGVLSGTGTVPAMTNNTINIIWQ